MQSTKLFMLGYAFIIQSDLIGVVSAISEISRSAWLLRAETLIFDIDPLESFCSFCNFASYTGYFCLLPNLTSRASLPR